MNDRTAIVRLARVAATFTVVVAELLAFWSVMPK